jgi:hypothetical protein
MNKEAKNMEAIYKAKEHHDRGCKWKGTATRIYMTWFDMDRMGWEEGDTIAGLTLCVDASIGSGRFRVECDNEPKSEPEITEEVKDKDLVHA